MVRSKAFGGCGNDFNYRYADVFAELYIAHLVAVESEFYCVELSVAESELLKLPKVMIDIDEIEY